VDSSGKCHYLYKGQWNEKMSFCPYNSKIKEFDEENSEVLWEIDPNRENLERLYYFSTFALQLNKITPELKLILPPTDSRLRPDQRALENGDLTFANTEKHRLEEKQRKFRKIRETENIKWAPKYFKKYNDPDTGLEEYKYTNNYWEDREKGNWSHLPDLFGED